MGTRQSCSKACSNCAADCTRSGQGYGDDFDDERPGGDPAGATFEETLEDLSSLDRHLMLFCATSNLSAVRWLLHLGAHQDACDANGTTCLHVACRAGALAVVKDMMQHKDLLQATDAAGWTPLHIAVLMGRREVVVRLLQAGACHHTRNAKGQVPAELCADNGTYEAIRSYELHMQQSPGTPWAFSKDTGPGEDIIGSRLQYEPFFVPRQPVIRSQQYKKEFQRIGMLIFNRQPGFGLAFLVASGVARDYPVDMSTFLRRSKVDIKQVGAFLGEAFSLSHTIRLEFINSVVLQNTGVVSALIQVFHMLQLPDDLQKINRLVHGVARIWWRQHERMLKDVIGNSVGASKKANRGPGGAGAQGGPQLHLAEELTGLELKSYLTSSDALHQIMFSTVMLHWYLYKDGTCPKREMEYAQWKKLNAGIETGGGDVPEHVQHQIYTLVGKAFIPELAVATVSNPAAGEAAGGPDAGGGHGPGDDKSLGDVASERPRMNLLTAYAAAEGWAQMVGGGFPRPSGMTGVQTVTYRHVSSIFSEITHNTSSLPRSPLGAAGGESALNVPATRGPVEATYAAAKRDDFAWMSLCYTLLFFSAAPQTGAPYAFVELRKVCVANLDEEGNVLSLVGAPESEETDADLAAAGGVATSETANTSPTSKALVTTPVTIVLLLPDGRWQELNLPKLELRVPTAAELGTWSTHLVAASQGRVLPGAGLAEGVHDLTS
mmetsp:Transcript_26759/g.62407  ORF Transcript_26759/g.62407 Transcript_26759/m.62407 type:complete len:720 (-) Transcript_26759:90-2249(-)